MIKKKFNSESNFMKVYVDLFDVLSPEATLMLSNLIDIEPAIKKWDGDYMRVSHSFIRERLDWSDFVINKTLQEIEECGFISTKINVIKEHGSGVKAKFIRINHTNLHTYLDTDDDTDDDIDNHANNHIDNHADNHAKKFDIKHSNIITDKHSNNLYEIETYLLQLTIPSVTKDNIILWYKNQKKKPSVEQLQKKLQKLFKECNNDVSKVSEAIESAYINNYVGWFAPKTTTYQNNKQSGYTQYGEPLVANKEVKPAEKPALSDKIF